MDLQRQYSLRNRNVVVDPPKKAPEGQALGSQPTKNHPRREMVQQKCKEKDLPKDAPPKDKEIPKENIPKEKDLQKEEIKKEHITIERLAPPFSLQNKISKIKIVVPFNEILRNPEYKGHLSKMIKSEETSDSLNIQDDHPKIMFGPWAKTSVKSEDVPPFYISLRIHDMFLHNAMFDSGDSHNLMPKIIMDNLGLDITRPYKYLYLFYSREVKCLGLIKDLVVVLHQIPEKSLVMDVVVVDSPKVWYVAC